jgi:hypothetical protein
VARLVAAESSSPADWLVESLTTFGKSVLSLVPARFETYVRVFHRGRHEGRALRWAEIAAEHGRIAHAGMQLGAIAGDLRYEQLVDDEVWDHAPGAAALPYGDAEIVAGVLDCHTTTRERCWFALWTGWHQSVPDWILAAPTFELPNRGYYLLAGAVTAATASLEMSWPQTANLWWPDDHAWCVATEIDLKSTYVGSSQACAEELLAQPGLEVYEIDPATGVDWLSDEVNPKPRRD